MVLRSMVWSVPVSYTHLLELKKGAEVFFSPALLECDPRPLCLEGTGLMLVELPVTYRPQWTVEVLYQLGTLGITPLIAHVERYPYVMEDPNLLIDWIEAGAYTHVNASSLVLHLSLRHICKAHASHPGKGQKRKTPSGVFLFYIGAASANGSPGLAAGEKL